jgi:gliding motility-associated lipoprotein GldD
MLGHHRSLSIYCWILATVGLGLLSCKPAPYPRPKAYARIEMPAHAYQKFESNECPFSFEYPAYGQLDTRRIDSCFFNIRFPQYGCTWHITTRDFVRDKATYYQALEDYKQVIFQHSRKGGIQYKAIKTPYGKGLWFDLYGQVPTSADFFFSDSTRFALINSFYFNTAEKNDSLAPVIHHMKKDLEHMVQSIRWK